MNILLDTLVGTFVLLGAIGSPFLLCFILGWIKQRILGPKTRPHEFFEGYYEEPPTFEGFKILLVILVTTGILLVGFFIGNTIT